MWKSTRSPIHGAHQISLIQKNSILTMTECPMAGSILVAYIQMMVAMPMTIQTSTVMTQMETGASGILTW